VSILRIVLAVFVTLLLVAAFGYVQPRLPRYEFAAPHQGYLASALAAYDLRVPAHTRLFTRIAKYISPTVEACSQPQCNGEQNYWAYHCPDPFNPGSPCNVYKCQTVSNTHLYCVPVSNGPYCDSLGCPTAQNYQCTLGGP
jgi:hypothetical protein